MVADNETLVGRIRGGYSVSENMQLLYEKNLPLIKKLIKPYTVYECEADLLQESYFGLWEAVQHYESAREVLFMTYAQYWILAAVRKYLELCGSTVRLPNHIRQELTRCSRAADQIRREYGREPCLAEIASFTGIPEKEVQKIKEYAQGVDSLDTPIAEDGSLTLSDTLQGDSDPENEAIDKTYDEHSKSELWGIVERYTTERENEIIREIFINKKTMAAVAREQGIGIERVRQLKEKALRKLKAGKARRELMEKFEVAETMLYRGGLTSYRRHDFVSVVERVATRKLEIEERYRQILAEIERAGKGGKNGEIDTN
jgi:RNA polymerase sigma factor (sigma-70 family)|nr:sigma-70 family RNA polymerase sigma factor [uncultured Acetatifactor sp.]